jgi:2-polyprenyl-3-methyl-5-hydroxy-6-metoxy-1,4-benzoquinol methylase
MSNLDVSSSHFWNQCYQEDNIGWDLGYPTPIFMDWCDGIEGSKKICVPGAGNGYDPLYFASKGHSVTAIDFAQYPVDRLKKESKKNGIDITILQKNIFDLGESLYNTFDYIVEYTCYCAIDPKMRYKYIETMYKILKDGGEIVAILLPLNKKLSEGGPPFGVDLNATINIFNEKFTLIESIKHPLTIKPRVNNEQFIRFVK